MKITSVNLSDAAVSKLEHWRGKRSQIINDLIEMRNPVKKAFRREMGAFIGEEYNEAPEEGVVIVELFGVKLEFPDVPDFSNKDAWMMIETGLDLLLYYPQQEDECT